MGILGPYGGGNPTLNACGICEGLLSPYGGGNILHWMPVVDHNCENCVNRDQVPHFVVVCPY